MVQHHQSAHRLLRLTERGSGTIEGAAGLAIAFLLLTLLIQLGFAMAARSAAEAAVAAAARRAARPDADLAQETAALTRVLSTSIPGAGHLMAVVVPGRAEAVFSWDPPGPRWIPLTIRVEASAPPVVPP